MELKINRMCECCKEYKVTTVDIFEQPKYICEVCLRSVGYNIMMTFRWLWRWFK